MYLFFYRLLNAIKQTLDKFSDVLFLVDQQSRIVNSVLDEFQNLSER